jgi:hypothetical protein
MSDHYHYDYASTSHDHRGQYIEDDRACYRRKNRAHSGVLGTNHPFEAWMFTNKEDYSKLSVKMIKQTCDLRRRVEGYAAAPGFK